MRRAPPHLLVSAVLLLLGLHRPCIAEEDGDVEPTPEDLEAIRAEEQKLLEGVDEDEGAEDPEDELDEWEKDAADEDDGVRWHVHDGFPFLEYNGFLEEDEGRDSTIHKANVTMDEAKKYCATTPECAAFSHFGAPTEGPVEMIFKDRFAISVDTEDEWTSYQKGDKMQSYLDEEEEKEKQANPFFHCEIQTCNG